MSASEMKFRPELSKPSDGTQIILVFDHPSQEFLLQPEAYKVAAAQAGNYGFGGAYTQEPNVYLIDKTTDKAVGEYKQDMQVGWRGEFPFIKPT